MTAPVRYITCCELINDRASNMTVAVLWYLYLSAHAYMVRCRRVLSV